MKRPIATGAQDFEGLRVHHDFYVDKTDFIREWWENRDAVTLITRPRRFGKTLNMSMLKCFFSNQYQNRGDLFEGLRVWNDAGMREEQGKWPVLFISFADVKQSEWKTAKRRINRLLADLLNEYEPLLQSKTFTDMDLRFFQEIGPDMPDDVAAASVKKLCEWLYRYYGKKVLIFLDEYDTPMQEAYISGFWDEVTDYIRAMFNSMFKTNPYLERAVMTGITRVSKESIFSDLNNLKVITTSSDEYASCFGFTEEEVFAAMDERGFSEKDKLQAREWYDGFTFGPVTDIYNPWSLTNYFDTGKIDTYWANSSSNSLVGRLLRQSKPEIKSQFETLLNGGEITVPVDEQIVFNQLDSNPGAIWSLLLASGYLKMIRAQEVLEAEEAGGENRLYTLSLTNLEVRRMFMLMVQGWFSQTDGLSRFVSAMLHGDAESMAEYLNDVMLACMSSFDGGQEHSGKLPENFYHGLVLGLLAENRKRYLVRSNRESGYGRYDVMMEPIRAGDPAVIIEFKVLNTRRGEQNLEDTAANALKQIEEKKYETELISRGIPAGRILKYGFAFRGKECLIRKG